MEQQVIPSDYTQYAEAVEIIKHAIERCRYRSAAAVNKETLSLYFGVGKFVSENSRIGCWGTKALPTISKLLQRELPGLHGFSESGLKRMRSFYEEWRTFLIRPTVLGELENHSSEKGTALIHPTALGELDIDEHLLLQLIGQPVNTEFTWDDFVKISFSHHIEILTRSKDIAERLFYIHCAAQNAWSLSSLKNYLKEDIYSNRGSLPSNFLQVLPEAIYAVKATLAFKDEYMLEMVNLETVGEREQDWNEKVIENQIVTNIKQFILRFGNDFTFIDSQHRLIVAGEEMFADLVFFNRELNASVIVELKRGKFRPNYLGQLSGYLTVYDMTDKKPHENPSIGIVLCQDANRQFVEIMVRDYDKPMGVATYRTAQEMPENLRKTLPDIDKLQNLLSENDSKSETVR